MDGQRSDGDFEEEFEEEERALQSSGGARAWSLEDGPFKLVLVVNMELKMGKGKVRDCLSSRSCNAEQLCCCGTLGPQRSSPGQVLVACVLCVTLAIVYLCGMIAGPVAAQASLNTR